MVSKHIYNENGCCVIDTYNNIQLLYTDIIYWFLTSGIIKKWVNMLGICFFLPKFKSHDE